MGKYRYEIIILGGGMVGLTIAHQLLERDISKKILIVDKESELGLHSSGRNSGVLHAGIYYKPSSLKAQVCIEGARRLRTWVEERGLPINPCGKIVIPTKAEQDEQLDILAEQGRCNGAKVEIIDECQLREIMPEARSASGRALWSPNTAVVQPMAVLVRLRQELIDQGVKIIQNKTYIKAYPKEKKLELSDGTHLNYGHLYNCTGLQADRVALEFGIVHQYMMLPFKGIYWKLKTNCPFQPRCNLYPVPDLRVPFLGVHFTPSADPTPVVTIGPTATPALGRENYVGLEAIEPRMAIKNIGILARQYLINSGGIRRYFHQQAFLGLRPLFIKSAKELIPELEDKHIEQSEKIGIRAQLYNLKKKRLENDFLCVKGTSSTHILNAISPAFTGSFALADLIINKSQPE